jgi:hypothetical protein
MQSAVKMQMLPRKSDLAPVRDQDESVSSSMMSGSVKKSSGEALSNIENGKIKLNDQSKVIGEEGGQKKRGRRKLEDE